MHTVNTKLGRLTPIHDPAIILESHDCKSLVTKLANIPHTLVQAPQLHVQYAGYELRNDSVTVT